MIRAILVASVVALVAVGSLGCADIPKPKPTNEPDVFVSRDLPAPTGFTVDESVPGISDKLIRFSDYTLDYRGVYGAEKSLGAMKEAMTARGWEWLVDTMNPDRDGWSARWRREYEPGKFDTLRITYFEEQTFGVDGGTVSKLRVQLNSFGR